jgi:hypothetical protein
MTGSGREDAGHGVLPASAKGRSAAVARRNVRARFTAVSWSKTYPLPDPKQEVCV